MSFHLSFSGGINEYRLKLLPTADDGLFPSSETAYYWEPSNHATPMRHDLAARENGREAGISNPYLSGIPGWVRARLGLPRYSFSRRELLDTGPDYDNEDGLDENTCAGCGASGTFTRYVCDVGVEGDPTTSPRVEIYGCFTSCP